MLKHADTYICIILKRKGAKYRWMVLLMISSQALLTIFVCYWLISQFRQEKVHLHAQLKQSYLSVHDQLVDTLLLHHLIAPSLNDSMMVRINITEDRTTGSPDDSCSPEVIIKHVSMDSKSDSAFIAFRLEDALDHDSMLNDPAKVLKTPEEEMLVRSVKLFINQADEAFRADPSLHAFNMKIDSSDFKEHLKTSIDEQGQPFILKWPASDQAEKDSEKIRGLQLGGYPSMGVPEILVQHYNGYIIRLILPQILFGIILLGLSASALLFVYRSFRKQMALNKLRDDFIGNISHELKTPVSTVKLALEALGTFDLKKDPKVSGDYLQMASREVERLEELVGKVLDHEALEASSILLKKEPCDLTQMVQGLMRTLEAPIRKHHARVSVEAPDEPCIVLADSVYLEGVIINLVDNSLKYAGPEPDVLIRISCGPKDTLLSVQDNGPGIPEEYKKRIFEKFFRIPSGDRHDVKGYGLGLNFAAQVMAHHGGSISVKNLENGGSRFTLHFSDE